MRLAAEISSDRCAGNRLEGWTSGTTLLELRLGFQVVVRDCGIPEIFSRAWGAALPCCGPMFPAGNSTYFVPDQKFPAGNTAERQLPATIESRYLFIYAKYR